MRNLFSLSRRAAEQTCREFGASPVHAREILKVMYRQRPDDLDQVLAIPSLPRSLVNSLKSNFIYNLPDVVEAHQSSYDGSVKFVLGLADGSQIEAVLMPEKGRLTICLSSQVGCAQGCVFCHTGRMGLKRNLSAAEIIGQLVVANQWVDQNPDWLSRNWLPAKMRVTNVVFMGMGEPLDNVDAVADAIEIMIEPLGLGIGLRKISVSTAGHNDGLKAIFKRIPKVRVALSLHQAEDGKRSRIMPINKQWPIEEVLETIRTHLDPGISLLVQYTLIHGVNDSEDDAQNIIDLLSGMNAKVNLIPLNEVHVSRLQGPEVHAVMKFRDILHFAGIRTMIRYSKGQDIGAACGQLVRN